MRRLQAILLKPIPYYSNKYINIILGLIVFGVLALFHPFGLHRLQGIQRYIIEFGFGFITFAVVTVNMKLLPILFPNIFCEDNWKVYIEILFTLFTVTLISISNTLFLYLLGFINISFPLIIFPILNTIIVGIFPVSFLTLMKYNRFLKQNLKDAREINSIIDSSQSAQPQKAKLFKFSGLSENDKIEISCHRILYIQSQRNYIQFFYNNNDQCKSKLLRATMKELENALTGFDSLQRCHRSFIVNIDRVKKIEGDSLGYNLHLDNCENQIPVSRSYTKIFKQKFF